MSPVVVCEPQIEQSATRGATSAPSGFELLERLTDATPIHSCFLLSQSPPSQSGFSRSQLFTQWLAAAKVWDLSPTSELLDAAWADVLEERDQTPRGVAEAYGRPEWAYVVEHAARAESSVAAGDDVPRTSSIVSRTTPPDALQAAAELRSLLGLSWDQLAAMTGVNRSTYLNWKRSGARPRPTTLSKLMRVYGLAYTVSKELGELEATGWFRAGSPSPLDMLNAGDMSGAEAAARATLATARPPREARLGGYDASVSGFPNAD